MKTLSTIQKLSKIGKVLSKIVFIFCICSLEAKAPAAFA